MLKSERKLIVQDTAGELYFAKFGKNEFEVYPDMRAVEVVHCTNQEAKKFIKKFLTIKEVLPTEDKKDRPKRVYQKKKMLKKDQIREQLLGIRA